MRIAMLGPISWRTPPRHYGPWELVTSLLTEALVARGVDVTLFATADSETACKFACNNDPLRGDFRVQFRPLLTSCVSVLPFGPDGPGRALGDDWRGQDRRDTTRLF